MTITTAAPPQAPPTTETRLEKPPDGCRWLVLVGIVLFVFCAVVFRWFFLLITTPAPLPPTPLEGVVAVADQKSVAGDGTWKYLQVSFEAADESAAWYDVSLVDFDKISSGKSYRILVRPSVRKDAEPGTKEAVLLEEF